jgi:hypothetical protein
VPGVLVAEQTSHPISLTVVMTDAHALTGGVGRPREPDAITSGSRIRLKVTDVMGSVAAATRIARQARGYVATLSTRYATVATQPPGQRAVTFGAGHATFASLTLEVPIERAQTTAAALMKLPHRALLARPTKWDRTGGVAVISVQFQE